MTNNRQTYLPKAGSGGKDAVLAVGKEAWQRVTIDYTKKHSTGKGDVKNDNISESERRGLTKLLKRVKDLQIVINA